jgi:hypothetical protein
MAPAVVSNHTSGDGVLVNVKSVVEQKFQNGDMPMASGSISRCHTILVDTTDGHPLEKGLGNSANVPGSRCFHKGYAG